METKQYEVVIPPSLEEIRYFYDLFKITSTAEEAQQYFDRGWQTLGLFSSFSDAFDSLRKYLRSTPEIKELSFKLWKEAHPEDFEDIPIR